MNSPNIEIFLARLFIDPSFREEFIKSPRIKALEFGLRKDQAEKMESMDQAGLLIASHSFHKKREGYKIGRKRRASLLNHLRRMIR